MASKYKIENLKKIKNRQMKETSFAVCKNEQKMQYQETANMW